MTAPPAGDRPLVSVVIPAYNAEETLAETLASIRAQTYPNLEILVVDDGSSDATRALALRVATDDKRITVLLQDNAGVAAARNHGIRACCGEYLAFVDADDVWHPEKIEAQLEAIADAESDVGLVYCWSAKIDADGVVWTEWFRPRETGDVLTRLFRGNFVGNGSASLVRADLARAIGGFDSSLQAAEAQGCEDLLFYLEVAQRARFALVERCLVGYRATDANMSSDPDRMFRSWLFVANEMVRRHPQHRRAIRAGLAEYAFLLFGTTLIRARPGMATRFLVGTIRMRPSLVPWLLVRAVRSLARTARHSALHVLRYARTGSIRSGAPPGIYGRRFAIGASARNRAKPSGDPKPHD